MDQAGSLGRAAGGGPHRRNYLYIRRGFAAVCRAADPGGGGGADITDGPRQWGGEAGGFAGIGTRAGACSGVAPAACRHVSGLPPSTTSCGERARNNAKKQEVAFELDAVEFPGKLRL